MDPEQELETKIAQLRGIATFDVLDAEALGALAARSSLVRLAAGEELFRAGAAAQGGYVLTAGRIELMETRRDGVLRATLEVEPVALIGETALISAVRCRATAVAVEPAELLLVPRAVFLDALRQCPEGARKLRAAWSERLGEALGALDKVRGQLENPRPAPRRR